MNTKENKYCPSCYYSNVEYTGREDSVERADGIKVINKECICNDCGNKWFEIISSTETEKDV